MTPDWLPPILLTLKLAASTTLILMCLGIPLAWWLANTRSWLKAPLNAVISLPIVLPPTVIGFYLLLLLGPKGAIGQMTQNLGLGNLAFTFYGLLLGSVFYSMPFVVQPLQNAFESIGKRPMEAAASLGASPIDRFFSIALPLARPGLWTAAVLGFAHTVGEFGVVLMVGGNIEGQTRVLSVLLYDQVEAMAYADAHVLAACLLAFSFALLLVMQWLGRRTAVLHG